MSIIHAGALLGKDINNLLLAQLLLWVLGLFTPAASFRRLLTPVGKSLLLSLQREV